MAVELPKTQSSIPILSEKYVCTDLPSYYISLSQQQDAADHSKNADEIDNCKLARHSLSASVVASILGNKAVCNSIYAQYLEGRESLDFIDDKLCSYYSWLGKMLVQAALIKELSYRKRLPPVYNLNGQERFSSGADICVGGIPALVNSGNGHSRYFAGGADDSRWIPNNMRALDALPGTMPARFANVIGTTGITPYVFLIDPKDVAVNFGVVGLKINLG